MGGGRRLRERAGKAKGCVCVFVCVCDAGKEEEYREICIIKLGCILF